VESPAPRSLSGFYQLFVPMKTILFQFSQYSHRLLVILLWTFDSDVLGVWSLVVFKDKFTVVAHGVGREPGVLVISLTLNTFSTVLALSVSDLVQMISAVRRLIDVSRRGGTVMARMTVETEVMNRKISAVILTERVMATSSHAVTVTASAAGGSVMEMRTVAMARTNMRL